MRIILVVLAVLMSIYISGCQTNENSGPFENPIMEETPSESAKQSPLPQLQQERVIGSAKTVIVDNSEDRVNNLELAISYINGVTIEEGENFSFNAIVGTRNEEKGYEKAPIFVDGEKAYAYGGGVCQISTTVYQAAENARLEILERHDHSAQTTYALLGEDAAVSYGNQDMKFKNTTGAPIKVEVFIEDDNVVAQILK